MLLLMVNLLYNKPNEKKIFLIIVKVIFLQNLNLQTFVVVITTMDGVDSTLVTYLVRISFDDLAGIDDDDAAVLNIGDFRYVSRTVAEDEDDGIVNDG